MHEAARTVAYQAQHCADHKVIHKETEDKAITVRISQLWMLSTSDFWKYDSLM
jgi:hypothetical protein